MPLCVCVCAWNVDIHHNMQFEYEVCEIKLFFFYFNFKSFFFCDPFIDYYQPEWQFNQTLWFHSRYHNSFSFVHWFSVSSSIEKLYVAWQTAHWTILKIYVLEIIFGIFFSFFFWSSDTVGTWWWKIVLKTRYN